MRDGTKMRVESPASIARRYLETLSHDCAMFIKVIASMKYDFAIIASTLGLDFITVMLYGL